MRDIEFRVWDCDKNKYIYFKDTGVMDMNLTFDCQDDDFNSRDFNWNNQPIEQYTGLKDNKRGNKKVFEGDIYKWCGLILPITIDSFHGFRFMFGEDQLTKSVIFDGYYIGSIGSRK